MEIKAGTFMKIKVGNCIIGAFYERPDGEIIYTHTWDGEKRRVYYYSDGFISGSVSEDHLQKWTKLDIKDFPNAKDPRLPYTFDLFWDIKYMSQLKRELKGHPEEKEIRKTMKAYGIKLK